MLDPKSKLCKVLSWVKMVNDLVTADSVKLLLSERKILGEKTLMELYIFETFCFILSLFEHP